MQTNDNFYERCTNRIFKDGNKITKKNSNSFHVDGLKISRHCHRGETSYYVSFEGVHVPLNEDEKKELFEKIKREFENRNDFVIENTLAKL